MLGDITQAKNVYIVCGRTDMRKGIGACDSCAAELSDGSHRQQLVPVLR